MLVKLLGGCLLCNVLLILNKGSCKVDSPVFGQTRTIFMGVPLSLV
jgi:hypothetical protein